MRANIQEEKLQVPSTEWEIDFEKGHVERKIKPTDNDLRLQRVVIACVGIFSYSHFFLLHARKQLMPLMSAVHTLMTACLVCNYTFFIMMMKVSTGMTQLNWPLACPSLTKRTFSV